MAADDDTPITKAILDEVVDKLVKLIGDNGRKLDTDMADFRQELRLLSTSIKNVQTQVLDRQGRFDTDASSASRPSPAPTHKLRFPKFDGSDDPITWLHKGEQFFHAYGTPDHLKVSTAALQANGTTASSKTRASCRGRSSFRASIAALARRCAAIRSANSRICAAPRPSTITKISSWSS